MAFHHFRLRFAIGFFLAILLMVQSDESCNLDFEKTISTLFAPHEPPSLQILTLRRYLLKILQNMIVKAEEIEGWNGNTYPKRNIEALARAGYLHTLPEDEEDNQTEIHNKRSLESLVKNGQLPAHHYTEEEGIKRSIESLARNGELKRDIQRMLEELYNDMTYAQDKRNLASIARDGGFAGKRNAAALLKNDRYLNRMLGQERDDKRNIASLKANYKPKYKREITKRQADYRGNELEYPVYQSSGDYENLVQELLEEQRNQKRFLGSIAKTGWYDSPRSSSIALSGQRSPPGKRHIGSLARLGWLPTVRNVRRFSRSGRSYSGSCRSEWMETPTDGQGKNYYISDNSVPLDDKRFLPVPAMWKVPLQTFNY
ncbi:hypothetical protein WA026_001831 [Henosepilachna vigintioctopunctata]|uniref:Neuropeptide-like 1 n=1 Tax=Henosepilachna vigintioctopunctata TaxID=420089 RepID=A0AAW1UJD8_9CUCU